LKLKNAGGDGGGLSGVNSTVAPSSLKNEKKGRERERESEWNLSLTVVS
jgi:hypothetical protein